MDDDMDYDYMHAILDEIALEGLDGLTLPSLWKRLDKRPKFPFPMDSDSKSFVWNCLVPDESLEFFELPEPRTPLVIFNRYQNMDMEFGIVVEHEQEIPDPYPYVPVEDKHVKGSCSNFKTRINVTHLIRDKTTKNILMRLQDVFLKWPREQLVIVASQTKRNLALLGSDVSPSTSFGLIQYCLLERIARSRHHGEVTCGKNSLVCLKLPPKTLFYYRKVLLANKIIVKQYHYQKSKEGQLVKGSLLQLARFYVERKSKMEVLIIKMCQTLENKPKKEEEFGKLRTELGLKPAMFKKMFGKIFQTCVKVKVVNSSEFYPDLPKEEHYSLNGKERLIKVVELVKPYDDHEDDDMDDDEEKQVDKQVHFSPSKIVADRPILCQTLKVIDDAGSDGANSVSIGKALGLPKLETRGLLRILDRKGVVITVMQDSGRQRSLQYISKRFEDESKAHKRLLEMRQKLKNFTTEAEEELPCSLESANFSQDLNNMDHMNVSVQATPQDAPRKPSKSWSFSLKDINNINKKLNVPSFTYRMLKRANRIIELVKEYKVFDQLHKIQKKIIEEEAEEGVVEKLDRASFTRIIHRLAKDGYIQSIKTILNFDQSTRKMHLICDRSVTYDDPLIKRAIDDTKMRYISSLGHAEPKPKPDQREEKENDPLSLSKPESEIKLEYSASIGKVYGFQPKCVRMKTLHELLCYLVYFYEGNQTPSSPSGKDGVPPVFLDCEDWRRFLHPIAKRPELKEGFVYFADLMHCLPASLLVRIVNFNYKILGFEDVLKDERKRNYLIQHFPPEIRNGLLYHRKYVHSIHEVMMKLAFNGLVTFVTQKMKEKEKSLIYVRRKTCLADTSSSNPSYLHVTRKEYPKINYEFQNNDDVRDYWMNVERISLHTPLGMYVNDKNLTVTVFDVFHKPELEEASRPKEINDIVDDFKVPGDGLGACGFDSAMYFHLKRNWNWPSISARTNRPAASKKETLPINMVGNNYISYLASNEEKAQSQGSRKRLGKFIKKTVAPKNATDNKEHSELESSQSVEEPEASSSGEPRVIKMSKTLSNGAVSIGSGGKKRKMKPTIRVIKRNYKKVRKPYYDEADKVALDKMTKLRVTWTAQEDSFLLLCKVASCFLDPYYKMVVPYSVVRDLIHEHLPNLSTNKSSKACQRRILYMLKNPLTVTNVSVYLGEANQDSELVKQFQGPKPNKNQDAVWKSMFTEVLKYLINKFTTKPQEVAETTSLPESVEDFKRKYQFSESGSLKRKKYIHVTPKNTIDIHCSVVFSVVLQGLNCVGDKTNWSYTLYKIYQCYPDTLLRSVIAKLKHEGIITKRKEISKREEVSVPFSAMPHRLSSKFEFLLQGKYQDNLFQDTYEFFNKMLEVSRKSEELELSSNIDGYETATLAIFMATKNINISIKIPEQIIVFDSKLTEEFKQKLFEKTSTQSGGSCVPAPAKASRFALYMMRHDLTEPLTGFQVVQHSHDSFLINSCKLKASLESRDADELNEEKMLNLDTSMIRNLIDAQRVLLSTDDQEVLTLEELKKFYNTNGHSSDEAIIGWEIYSAILNKKEIGCTIPDLLEIGNAIDSKFGLYDHLQVLLNSEAIISVGVVQRNYVAQVFAGPWILNSVKIPKENRGLATVVAMRMNSCERSNSKQLNIEDSEALEALRDGVENEKSFKASTPATAVRSKRKLSGEVRDSDETTLKKARLEEIDYDPSLISIWLNESVLKPVCQNNDLDLVTGEAQVTESDEVVASSSKIESIIPMESENSSLNKLEKQIPSQIPMETEDAISNSKIALDSNAISQIQPDNLLVEVKIMIESTNTSSNMVESEVLKWLEENVLNKVQTVSTVTEDESESLPQAAINPKSQESTDTSEATNENSRDTQKLKERVSLKSWLEAKVTREVEALHQTANKSASDNSSVAEINRWLQESIVKKLEDKCSVADIKLWFQKCILEKVENQSAINDLQQWFQDSILRTLEDQTFLDDLEIMRQAEEERIVEKRVLQLQQAQEFVEQVEESVALIDSQVEQVPEFLEVSDSRVEQVPESLELRDSQVEQVPESIELSDSQVEEAQETLELEVSQVEQLPESLELRKVDQAQESLELNDSKVEQTPEKMEVCANNAQDNLVLQSVEVQQWLDDNLPKVIGEPETSRTKEPIEAQEPEPSQPQTHKPETSPTNEALQAQEPDQLQVKEPSTTSQTNEQTQDSLEIMEVDPNESQIKLAVSHFVEVQQFLEDNLSKVEDGPENSQSTEPIQTPESLELMDVSANESLANLVVSQSIDVQQWLEDTVSKVHDKSTTQTKELIPLLKPILEDLSQWFEESVLERIQERETREELRHYLNDEILKKVDDANFAHELKEWMENSLLSKIEDKIEADDLKRWFEEKFSVISSLQSLQKRVKKAEVEEIESRKSTKEFKEWFEKTLIEKVENQEIKREVSNWFDSKVLTTLEALSKILPTTSTEEYQDLPLDELKNWLDRKIISRITDAEDVKDLLEGTILPEVVHASNLRKWLENDVLSIVEEMDHSVSNSDSNILEISDLLQWFDKNLLHKVKDTENVTSWLEANVSKMMEDSLEVNSALNEATVSILTCLKDLVSKVSDLDIVNVVCCLKDVVSKVERDEIKRIKKEELRKWFEERIFTRLETSSKTLETRQELLTLDSDCRQQQSVTDIEKDVSDLLETEVLSKIDETYTKMTTRKRRKRTLSSTTSNVTVSQGLHCEPIKFISRIWKKPDGGLNRPILRKLLSSVLSHIMANPGISEKQIFEKFEMCMPPVQLLDLLDILKKIGCLEVIYLKHSCKPGIFSPSVNYSVTETLNMKDYHQTFAYYEATIYAIVKLGKFFQELIISH